MVGKKILVADDSLTIQKVIRLALANEGYELQAVSDGNYALQQISVWRPHVVLIDISLPGKNAFEVKKEVNQNPDLSQTYFVLMWSAFEKIDEAQANEVQFQGRLMKPFDPASLRQTLEEGFASEGGGASSSEALPPEIALPVQPADIPPIPAPPNPEILRSLWEDPISPSLEEDEPASLAPAQAPMEEGSSNDQTEIKSLTESTLQITGLDHLDEFLPDSNPKDGSAHEWNVDKPPVDLSSQPSFTIEPPMSDGEMPAFKPENAETANSIASAKTLEVPPYPNIMPSGPKLSEGPSQAEIESMVARQVEATLSQFAQKLLPEIAEKVVKNEIHKILSDPSLN